MNDLALPLNRPGYCAKRLERQDATLLQTLYEQCADYALFSDGQLPSPIAAHDEFDNLPKGKTTEDKYIFGLFDPHYQLVGMIESIRHYPDEQIWWLGLMMLLPAQRGQGLGWEFYQAFEQWVSAQAAQYISLCAIETNELGLRFWQRLEFKVIRKTEPRPFGRKTHAVYVLRRAIPAIDDTENGRQDTDAD